MLYYFWFVARHLLYKLKVTKVPQRPFIFLYSNFVAHHYKDQLILNFNNNLLLKLWCPFGAPFYSEICTCSYFRFIFCFRHFGSLLAILEYWILFEVDGTIYLVVFCDSYLIVLCKNKPKKAHLVIYWYLFIYLFDPKIEELYVS